MRFSILTILAVVSAAFAFDFNARPFNEAPHCAACSPLFPRAYTVVMNPIDTNVFLASMRRKMRRIQSLRQVL